MDWNFINNKQNLSFKLLHDCINELKYGKNLTYLLNERYNLIDFNKLTSLSLFDMN